jgi:hypothetical protein
MRTNDQKSHNLLSPLLVAGVFAVASFVGAVDLARAVADMGPQVGDVITFLPDRGIAPDINARLDVARASQGTCRLDVTVLHKSGGSLVVEQRAAEGSRLYRVHWSGARTSADNGNCGASADLSLRNADMEVLAMAAGGYGVGQTKSVVMGAFGSEAEPIR